jgi:hypothetical protein
VDRLTGLLVQARDGDRLALAAAIRLSQAEVWRVAAHLVGLLFPQAILAWTRTPGRLLALEAFGFALGLTALAGLCRRHPAPIAMAQADGVSTTSRR